MPDYQPVNRVAIIAYSQGTLSSRYYIKHLMGSRRANSITVSEFITLAAPNHGISRADMLPMCGTILPVQDKARRQLCGGLWATSDSENAPCGACGSNAPSAFNNNSGTDASFITDLNGHPFIDNCGSSIPANPSLEAPFSRPSTPDGILYVNIFAAGNDDTIVGGAAHQSDCVGRRLAYNHAPDANNREITGLINDVHAYFPHYWPTICMALKSVIDQSAPADQLTACQGLTEP